MTARKIEYMKLDAIKPATKNVRQHDIGAINQSMSRFGYVEAVQFDERTKRLVAGHGRIDTLKSMRKDGQPPPPGIEVRENEWWVPVQRGWASKDDDEAKAYLIAANRVQELGGWDIAARDEVLAELAKSNLEALAGSGYDADDVERILHFQDFKAPGSPAQAAEPASNPPPADTQPVQPSELEARLGKARRAFECPDNNGLLLKLLEYWEEKQ